MGRARGERDGQQCLSMYSITENIYYSQLSSVAILLQPELDSHRMIQGNDCVLSLCAVVLRSPPPSHVSTSKQLFCVHYTSILLCTAVRKLGMLDENQIMDLMTLKQVFCEHCRRYNSRRRTMEH
jgi:hypothetical protein